MDGQFCLVKNVVRYISVSFIVCFKPTGNEIHYKSQFIISVLAIMRVLLVSRLNSFVPCSDSTNNYKAKNNYVCKLFSHSSLF